MTESPKQLETPLANVPAGRRVRIANFAGGRMLRSRLASLGLNLGQEVTILQNNRGLIMVGVNGGRVALGRGVSQKILTVPVGE
uniref:Ferrous iron transport protein A n=1 Tax=Desulfobacca acetoxidans TaxID=60893 RepID=A0A7C3Z7I0_9BACT